MRGCCQLSAWTQAMERHPGRILLEDDSIRPDQEFMAAAHAGDSGDPHREEPAPSPAWVSVPLARGKLCDTAPAKEQPQQWHPRAGSRPHRLQVILCHLIHITIL